MRSECQFFMSQQDEDAFLKFAYDKFGLTCHGDWLSNADLPAEAIQFDRSRQYDTVLTAGRIALATHDLEGVELYPGEGPRLEKAFRGLRGYIRKHFNNQLAAYTNGQRSQYTYRNLWLGPDAESWLAAVPGATLLAFRGATSNFIPEEP